MRLNIRFAPALIALALVWTSLTAVLTLTPGCAQVEPGGVYQGDNFLFNVDQAILTGKDTIHVFLTWEYNNRKLLSGTPEITKAADNIRRGVKSWFGTATRLRDAYASNPTAENKKALQEAIDVINQAVKEGLFYLSKYGPNR